jgi:hypothetical protein
MNKYLSQFLTAAVVILVTVSGALAQDNYKAETKINQKEVFQEFEICLQRSDVPGFVESTLYTIVQCKDRYPELDYSRILKLVDRVAKEDGNSSIGYKAYLVSMYLTHSSEIHVKPIPFADQHDYLFKQIADQLEGKYLTFDGGNDFVVNK